MPYKNKEDKKEYMEKWRQDNPEKIKAGRKRYKQSAKGRDTELRYRLNHPGKERERRKRYRLNHPEERRIYRRKYYIEHSAEEKAYCVNYQRNHPEYKRQWLLDNPEWQKQYNQEHKKERNELLKNRYKTDLKFNLSIRMSSMIYHSLMENKAGNHWESLVGYTLIDLIKRLNKTMPQGFTWKDFLSGELHIDHKIPISAFNFDRPEHIDFKRCWALENLRLLPAKENLIKHNKLDRPFQPALRI